MENLTLIIPAKKEKESLPIVLEELKQYKFKIKIFLEKDDKETIESIKNYAAEVIYQDGKGYGDALISGIKNTNTEYFCIFNADGSFKPSEIAPMFKKIIETNSDFIFGSRYEKGSKSEDDTIVTYIGNFFFTKLGKYLFNLNISDILYTFVIGNTFKAKNLELKYNDFRFCVELPIKAKIKDLKLITHVAHERSRIGGKKKVNAFKDGFLILMSMLKLFLNK